MPGHCLDLLHLHFALSNMNIFKWPRRRSMCPYCYIYFYMNDLLSFAVCVTTIKYRKRIQIFFSYFFVKMHIKSKGGKSRNVFLFQWWSRSEDGEDQINQDGDRSNLKSISREFEFDPVCFSILKMFVKLIYAVWLLWEISCETNDTKPLGSKTFGISSRPKMASLSLATSAMPINWFSLVHAMLIKQISYYLRTD